MGSTHAGKHPAEKWPLMPLGGYQRATPRDALTGEPIRPDTVHKSVHDPLGARDNGAHSERKRSHHSRVVTRPTGATISEPLPILRLDDLAADDLAADAQTGDEPAAIAGQEVAEDGE